MWGLRARLQPCGAARWHTLRSAELLALQNAADGRLSVAELLLTPDGQARCLERARWHVKAGRTELAASCLDFGGQPAKGLALLDAEDPAQGGVLIGWLRPGDVPAREYLRAVLQRNADMVRRAGASDGSPLTRSSRSGTVAIPRVDASRLTRREFRKEFVEGQGRPVILTGLSALAEGVAGIEGLIELVGHCKVPLRQRDSVPAPENWAALTDVDGSATLGALLASLRTRADRSAFVHKHGSAAQLFDWSIWQNCPAELGPALRIPGLFAGDLLQQLEAVLPGYTSPFPTLFAAPAQTGSGLHIDVGETHFWMSLLHGRKRWRLVGPAGVPHLRPRSILEMNPRFLSGSLEELVADPSAGQAKWLSSSEAAVFEGELKAGETIFVPANWAHEVSNLDHTVAISANFVDGSNLNAARQALKLRALVCRGSCAMSLVLNSDQTTRIAEAEEEDWAAVADEPALSEEFGEWKARWQIFLSPAETAGLANDIAQVR